jgi:uncharacterized MAPEG superfamily protein
MGGEDMMGSVPTELKLLGVAVVIGLVQIFLGAGAATRDNGMAWNAGPRDVPIPPGVAAGRLDRALRNFLETFPLFAAMLLADVVAGKLGAQTLWGTWLYVVARAVYVPLYAVGVPVVRSLVWAVSLVGFVMVTAALFV